MPGGKTHGVEKPFAPCHRAPGAAAAAQPLPGPPGRGGAAGSVHPHGRPRARISHARALGVLLRSILVEREPVYRQHETVQAFAPAAFGLEAREVAALADDRIGRALDRLFDADRGTMFTELVVAMQQRFGLEFGCLRNDTTSIRLTGQYAKARGRSLRGRKAPWITYGYSKDHRPGSQAAHPRGHDERRRQPAGAVPLRGRQHERRQDPRRDLGLALPAGGRARLPLRRGLQALQRRRHGPHRPAAGSLRDGPAALPEGGRALPGVDPEPRTRLDGGREPPQPAPKATARGTSGGSGAGTCPPGRGGRSCGCHSNLLALRQAARREENLARAVQDLEGVRPLPGGPSSPLRGAPSCPGGSHPGASGASAGT